MLLSYSPLIGVGVDWGDTQVRRKVKAVADRLHSVQTVLKELLENLAELLPQGDEQNLTRDIADYLAAGQWETMVVLVCKLAKAQFGPLRVLLKPTSPKIMKKLVDGEIMEIKEKTVEEAVEKSKEKTQEKPVEESTDKTAEKAVEESIQAIQ